jgi:DNA-binding MarR family transcriptional regulator
LALTTFGAAMDRTLMTMTLRRPIGQNNLLAPATPVPDVLRFLELLWALTHGLDRTSKRMTRDLGVTGPQRLVLRVVGLFPGASAGDIAGMLHVHASTLTGVLQRLETQGLLQRMAHPGDRRRAVLHLTPRGKRANQKRGGTVESAVADALTGINSRDREATVRVLQRVVQRLEHALDAAEPAAPGHRAARARRSARRQR